MFRARWIVGAALALVGCRGTDALKGSSPRDSGQIADGGQVARIVMSASTNSAEIDVVVYGDASAVRTIGPAHGSLSGTPATFPAGSPEGMTVLSDLAAVGDVAQIPISMCGKSASFGTTTTVTTDGKTSGDLQCVENPTAAVSALVTAVNALLDNTP
jgi:hypothetical protein